MTGTVLFSPTRLGAEPLREWWAAAMDYQCLFANEVLDGIKYTQNPDFSFHRPGPSGSKQVHQNETPNETQFYAGHTLSDPVRMIRLMRFSHIKVS